MDPSDVTTGQLVLVTLLVLGVMALYPFAKAYLMCVATRMLKFQSLSYWKAFFCVLIGIGATMAVQTILSGLAFQPGQQIDPEVLKGVNLIAMSLGLILTPIAEAVSLLLFFKESMGKTIGVTVLTNLFTIIMFIVSFLIIFVLLVLINLATG